MTPEIFEYLMVGGYALLVFSCKVLDTNPVDSRVVIFTLDISTPVEYVVDYIQQMLNGAVPQTAP